MAKKVGQRKKPAAPIQAATNIPEPEWVASMHEYHRRTGLYRTEDLNRVLGDPRHQVSGQACDDFALACGISNKE